MAGKSIPAEGCAKCFGFVQEVDAKPRRRVLEVLRSQGLQANQSVEFFTDGAAVLRSLTSYLSAESPHILDWFHLTMRLTVPVACFFYLSRSRDHVLRSATVFYQRSSTSGPYT